jgi:mono/diheme cytochrome c family protein
MRAVLSLVCLALSACNFGAANIEEVDPEAIPLEPTYSAHIQPIMEFYCVACHDPEGQAGAAQDVDLTSYEAVVNDYDDIAEALFDKRYMPPGGARRLSSEDEATLARWATQGFACGEGPECE